MPNRKRSTPSTNMKQIIRGMALSLLCTGWLSAARAQQDSLAGIRTFLKVCNGYKQLPVLLDVGIERQTNFITGRADTTRLKATFCLQAEGSYIAMDNMEQLANDSLLLLVNKQTRRMIV